MGLAVAAAGPAVADEVPAATERCAGLRVYSIDRDRAGLNVRTGPGTQYQVLARLKPEIEDRDTLYGAELTVIGSLPGWLRVESAETGGYTSERQIRKWQGPGWVAASLVGVNTAYGGGIELRSTPAASSRLVARLPMGDDEMAVLGCRAEWLRVRHKRHGEGWTTQWCSNQATNCS